MSDDPIASNPPVDPPPPYTMQIQDGTTVQQWDVPSRTYRLYQDGVLVLTRPFTDAENATADARIADATRDTNQATLLQQARTAIVNNLTYLNKVQAGTAVTADHIAQVPALTRQMQGVIRLLVGSDLLDQT